MQAFVPGDDYSQFGIVHGYGLGLEQYSNEVISVDGHMGTGQAQSAFLGYDLEHGTAVAVMTNTPFRTAGTHGRRDTDRGQPGRLTLICGTLEP